MPVIRYILGIEDYELKEEETFPRLEGMKPTEIIQSSIVSVLKQRRQELGEPDINLLSAEIVNPYFHQHTWQKIRIDKALLRTHYGCKFCKVIGYIPYHIVYGPRGNHVRRSELYKSERWALCKDQLKQLPKIQFH